MKEVVEWLNGILWSPILVFLFLGLGLFYSIVTRFLQVRSLKDILKQTFKGNSSKSGVSSFQALSMSLGSRVGTGNIAGVATAIALGGPGAVFWMWVMALLGAATSFIEATLTQVFKIKVNGQYRGGTPFYIEKGLKIKWLAVLFSIITLVVMGVLWPGLQINTVSLAMDKAFGIKPVITGIVLSVILAIIIFGGVKRIAKAAEIVVPFMAIGYTLVGVIIMLLNISQLPDVISLIFSSAFGANAAISGTIGQAISWGVQRGAYSNAAGVGSETFEAGAAEVTHPAKQGLVQSFSVYIDTLLLCSVTAFMIIITGTFSASSSGTPSLYTQQAINSVFPGYGAAFLALALLFFRFTTVMSYYYKAETNLTYIMLNRKGNAAWPKNILRIVLVLVSFFGSVQTASLAWGMANIGLGAMAWLNLIALLFLTKPALKVLKDYERQKKAGKDPVFDPVAIGIEGANFWEKEYKVLKTKKAKTYIPREKFSTF
jgi:alanine or glycine:cation symporter, AGCS family